MINEKDFQQAVREYAELYGWVVYFTWGSRHSTAGDPDLRMVRTTTCVWPWGCPDGHAHAESIVCELKASTKALKKLTPEQYEALYLWGQVPGVEAYLWTPEDWPEIEQVLGRRSV